MLQHFIGISGAKTLLQNRTSTDIWLTSWTYLECDWHSTDHRGTHAWNKFK